MGMKAPRKDPLLIEDPMKPWSVKLLVAASAVAGLESSLPVLQTILPAHWYAYAFPAILLARVIKQTIEQK